ncbi:MAG: hypothetical protein ABL986_18045 [Vicinamibacterales bacterium]
MKRETLIWTIVMVLGAAGLLGRAFFSEQGMGREYVRAVPVANGQWTQYDGATYTDYLRAEQAQPGQTVVQLSLPRTVGLWLAAFFTLAVFSFLWGDNPFYRIAEHVFVGVSAAYWMVVAFWDVIVPNLIGKIWPGVVQAWALPGLAGPEAERNLVYVVPLVLGLMLLWRLMPAGGWIARWPLAVVVGTTAGLRLIGFLQGDFLAQIRNTILPLVVFTGGAFDFWGSVSNTIIVVGVLCCLTYFFFSFEHKGIVGGVAHVGIWMLMITFGAAFGYTVMGRIALLGARLEFLLDNWLWLIDPTGRRVVATMLFGLIG